MSLPDSSISYPTLQDFDTTGYVVDDRFTSIHSYVIDFTLQVNNTVGVKPTNYLLCLYLVKVVTSFKRICQDEMSFDLLYPGSPKQEKEWNRLTGLNNIKRRRFWSR